MPYHKGARRIKLLQPGYSRKENYGLWYAAHKDKINEGRRKKRKKIREVINAKCREWYANNRHRLAQFTPAGRFKRKLKRNGL